MAQNSTLIKETTIKLNLRKIQVHNKQEFYTWVTSDLDHGQFRRRIFQMQGGPRSWHVCDSVIIIIIIIIIINNK